MEKIKGLVSVIMPSYNSSKYISESINSVLTQSYSDWELLIYDDNSIDNTIEIVDQYIANNRGKIYLFKGRENLGAAKARNFLLKKAKGQFIAFLDSDDIWEYNKLKLQVEFLIKNNIDFCFTAYKKMNEDGVISNSIITPPVDVTYNELLLTNVVGCSTVLFDRIKAGDFLFPDIRKRQDFALWLEMLKSGAIFKGMSDCLVIYRVRKNSISSNKIKAACYNWYVYRKIEKINIIKSLYIFFNYAFNGFIKSRIK